MVSYAEDFYYEFAIKLIHDAAHILKEAINGVKKIDEKLGNWDLVTEYDRKIEDLIIGQLKTKFPDHKFIGEESIGKELPELTNDPTWIIDPIDGTTNFVHAFPHTCIVIGLAIKKEMVIGIVYNPILEQLFTARKGRGAFLNNKPIKVSKVQDLSKALVCMESGFIKIDYLREKTIERLRTIIQEVQGIRTLGVAALSLCYIAMGIVDAYYVEGPGISTWDIAAASLIISEAGGIVVDRVTGEKIDIMKPRAIGACNEKIANKMVKLIREADQKVIKSAINLNKNVKSKGIDWDLVTEYDRKIENDLQKELLNKYPNHRFIGEETTAEKNCLPKLTDEPTWIIDPIDGTTNFVHQFPHTCISLALIINKSIEIGIVYNPLMMQFFSAKRQKGAFLNGHRIKTSKITDLSESLIAMEPWIAKNPNYLVNIYTRMHALIQRTHGIRSLGTAALTLCYVAMGAIEAYHVESIDAWDVAAGKLIIEEAGGTVIDTEGGELDLITPRVIAACNHQIADQLVNLFKTADLKTIIKNFK